MIHVFSFAFQNVAPAQVKVIVQDNVMLKPAHDVYIVVNTSITYSVVRLRQGKVTGQIQFWTLERFSNACQSNSTIELVLVIWFSHWLLEMVINTILPIIIRRSSVLLFTRNQVDRGSKPSVQLVCVMPPRFQSFKVTNVIGFNFAPTWFVKTSRLLREFHWFVVGWKWKLACPCDWLCHCFDFDFAILKTAVIYLLN